MAPYAAGWTHWFPVIEGAAAALTERMIALGEVGEGQRVLDIGTGIGEPALSAARAVGPGGSVIAIDPDPEMVAFARQRAALMKATNVTFLVRRAEDLELAHGSIDAVLCRWSLMFVDDVDTTLREIRHLLKPRGRTVLATWMEPERVPALSLARGVVHRHFGRAPPPYGPKTAFALSDAAALAEAVRRAGFDRIVQERVVLTYSFAGVEDYVRFREDCTGSLFSAFDDVGEDERAGATRAIAAALERFRGADGSIRISNEACCTAAIRGDG